MTNAELAILSLLVERPRHGYEIEKTIESRGMREWTEIGFSSIYYLLLKLQKAGLIRCTKEAKKTAARQRKVYAITPAGRAACAEFAIGMLEQPVPTFPPILLGLVNLPLLPAQKVQRALHQRRLLLHQRIAEIERKQESQAPLPSYVNAIFTYSLTLLQAELGWLNATITEMENQMNQIEKIDLRKELKHLYAPPVKKFSMVEVPPLRYLMVDGRGNPNTSEAYQNAVEALYSVSYTLKFMSKSQLGKDYVVLPLEGLWWADDMSSFTSRDKDKWHWTMMIMQPEWIAPEMIAQAIQTARSKKSLPGLSLVRHEMLTEGFCVQIMHIGSYDEEAPVLKQLHDEYMPQHGLTFHGKHHEIYLGDPRKTAPEKLKTVLRQPVKKI